MVSSRRWESRPTNRLETDAACGRAAQPPRRYAPRGEGWP